MNERTRREAERVALAQRSQLNALFRDFQRLDRHFAYLELESARQSDDLSRLKEQTRQTSAPKPRCHTPAPKISPPSTSATLRSHRPGPRAPTVPVHPAQPPTSRHRPSAKTGTRIIRNVERYFADHGIDATQDPLPQLLSAHTRGRNPAQVRSPTSAPRPWDRWDYGAVALAVLVGAVLDYLLVATPGGKFKGEPQRGSPLTAWMKDQSKMLAPIKSSDDIQRNAFQQWIAELTTAAEKRAKVPYDLVSHELGLTPNVHRLANSRPRSPAGPRVRREGHHARHLHLRRQVRQVARHRSPRLRRRPQRTQSARHRGRARVLRCLHRPGSPATLHGTAPADSTRNPGSP